MYYFLNFRKFLAISEVFKFSQIGNSLELLCYANDIMEVRRIAEYILRKTHGKPYSYCYSNAKTNEQSHKTMEYSISTSTKCSRRYIYVCACVLCVCVCSGGMFPPHKK